MQGEYLRLVARNISSLQHTSFKQADQHDAQLSARSGLDGQSEQRGEPEAGFTRSISLYWNWMKGIRGAGMVGKGLSHSSSALILQCEHWLEAADPKHRYGTNLRPYFDHWLTQQEAADSAHVEHRSVGAGNGHVDDSPPPTHTLLRRSFTNVGVPMIPDCDEGDAAVMEPRPHWPQAQMSSQQLSSTPDGTSSAHSYTRCMGIFGADSSSTTIAGVQLSPHEEGTGGPTTAWPVRSMSAPNLAALAALTSSKLPHHLLAHLPNPEDKDCANHRFFYWLDCGAGRSLDLGGCGGVSRLRLESERVTYLSEVERSQVEVCVVDGLLVYRVNGALVDTRAAPVLSVGAQGLSAVPLATQANSPDPSEVSTASVALGANDHRMGSGALSERQQGGSASTSSRACAGGMPRSPSLPFAPPLGEKPCKWIYVLDTARRLYVHAKFRGKFHHSSFVEGGAVLAAGGIVVERGRITKLTADSGHYRPSFESFMATVQVLRDMGADLSATKLSAKHIKCPELQGEEEGRPEASRGRVGTIALATGVGGVAAGKDVPIAAAASAPVLAVDEAEQEQPDGVLLVEGA